MRFVLLGEPATGKSSLLVAFYGALVNHRVPAARIVRTVDDVEFLSRGLESFGRCETLPRTEVGTHARVMVELAYNAQRVSIELPDRSGDLLKHMIDTRAWDPELQEQVQGAAGAMLFLRADQMLEADGERRDTQPAIPAPAEMSFAESTPAPPTYGAGPIEARGAPPAYGYAPPDQIGPPEHGLPRPWEAPAAEEPVAQAWSPSLMPVDVRAVDLLQALLEERTARLPLALIVSAWDRAGMNGTIPRAWLGERAPLLEQFLRSHADQLPHAVFGVSAQGSEFEDDARSRAQDQDPWDRAFVIGPDGLRGSVADPIMWLIDAAR